MKRYALTILLLAAPALAERPFEFKPGDGVLVTCDADSERAELPAGRGSVTVMNSGTTKIYFRFGDSSVLATDADKAMLPESEQLFSRSNSDTHIACITPSGTSTLEAMPGGGI